MEIDIDHYRFGMVLSMPVTKDDITLLDVGKTIDDETTLTRLRNQGIKRLDVEGRYAKELMEKYPDCYSSFVNGMSQAKEARMDKRKELDAFLGRARQVEKPPKISIAADAMRIPDLRRSLVQYFNLDQAIPKLNPLVENAWKLNLAIIHGDDFGQDVLVQFRRNALKENPNLKILVTYQNCMPDKVFDCSLRVKDNDTLQIIKAAFYTCFPKHQVEFKDPALNATYGDLPGKVFQLYTDPELEQELSSLCDLLKGIHVIVADLNGTPCHHQALLTVVRCTNEVGDLVEALERVRELGCPMKKVIAVSDRVHREQIASLKGMGLGGIILGDLNNDKLQATLKQVYKL